MSGVRTIAVRDDDAGVRVDRWFKRHFPGLAHGKLEKLLRTGQVRVDGGRVKAGTRLEAGQSVRVPPLPEEACCEAPRKAPVAPGPEDAAFVRDLILHEDESILVLNKPPGLAVQGGSRTTRHLDAMLAALETGGERPRLVHRLDRDTSGVLVVARTRRAAAALARSFRSRRTTKLYWGLTVGVPKPRRGVIDLALIKQKSGGGRETMAPAPQEAGARRAITHYAVLAEAPPKVAWLALKPVTGRTHQLRAHCAALGTPLIGDRKYGGMAAVLGGFDKRLHLHARFLTFAHPDGSVVSVSAPLPDHMTRAFAFLGFDPAAADDPFAGDEP